MSKQSQSDDEGEGQSIQNLMTPKNSLIVRSLDSNLNSAITEKGGKIGRDKSCEICLKSNEVSKFNSEVIFVEGGFYLSDKRSTNGTFVKMDSVVNRLKIELKMVIEVNNFQITVYYIDNKKNIIKITL